MQGQRSLYHLSTGLTCGGFVYKNSLLSWPSRFPLSSFRQVKVCGCGASLFRTRIDCSNGASPSCNLPQHDSHSSRVVQAATASRPLPTGFAVHQAEKTGVFSDIDFTELYDGSIPRVRVRQHVNPLKRELQVSARVSEWGDVFVDPQLPLILDLGCGYGRFLLALERQMKGYNFLGLDIRKPVMDRANQWAEKVEAGPRMHFMVANATMSMRSLLDSYPGPLHLVSIQYPDPQFKRKHRKRRMVQAGLVEGVRHLLAPGGRVWLQSDVLEVAESMRDHFERYGAPQLQPCPLHLDPAAVFHTSVPLPHTSAAGSCTAASQLPDAELGAGQAGPLGVGGQAGAGMGSGCADASRHGGGDDTGGDGKDREAQHGGSAAEEDPRWRSSWGRFGWLRTNPLGVPTEREVHTLEQGLPVYRFMLQRQK